MKFSEILLVVLFSFGMGIGQIIFKFVAERQLARGGATVFEKITFLLTDWLFIGGVAFYGLLLVYWVWLQTFLPLSRSYPFTLLSLVIASAGGYFYFRESISLSFLVGLAFVGVGLVILSR